jgi:hypothetical protein
MKDVKNALLIDLISLTKKSNDALVIGFGLIFSSTKSPQNAFLLDLSLRALVVVICLHVPVALLHGICRLDTVLCLWNLSIIVGEKSGWRRVS